MRVVGRSYCGFLAAAVAVAGCGGSKNETAAEISNCLKDRKGDYRVLSGEGIESTVIPDVRKATIVLFGSGNDAIVVAESDGGSAEAVERDFNTAQARAAKVERHSNVVVGWTRAPVDAEADALAECVG